MNSEESAEKLPLNRQKRSGDPALQDLVNIRHSLAHLLAAAVQRLYPTAKRAIGPAIENGFYYDFEFAEPISDKDLGRIEKEMRKTLTTWSSFTRSEKTPEEARESFKGNPYKLELIDEIVGKGENITFYESSPYFTDLCRGGHADDMSAIGPDSFTLSRIAGAYWRGDEKNAMLTRIYGLAFSNKEELDAYLTQQEEAKKRDHRKLGKELGLFVFSELVGPGLPLWTPKGTIIRELLNDYVWELRKARGYQKVTIPHITKKDLYETSGHWKKFAGELFKIKTREGHEYAMKPMNCPHHTQIFAAFQRSYRDMPQRYCETTMVYRDEQSGELSGLSRVLSITQDDAHVFCRESQIEQEVFAIWDMIDTFYKRSGFENLQVRFSRHDPETFAEKNIGTKEVWEKSESAILALMKKRGVENYIDGKGEAAMYGPKIDFISRDSIGRTLQVATIQLDFNQPANFGLACVNEKGEKEQVVMVHCAIMGSIERFMATLIEHHAGVFPTWLSPVQGVIIPVSEHHVPYAQGVLAKLRAEGFRIEVDLSNETLGKKIRENKVKKVPYLFVVGEKETENDTVSVESREKGSLGAMTISDLVTQLKEEQR